MIDVSCGSLALRERLISKNGKGTNSIHALCTYAPRRRIKVEALQKALREEKYREVSLVKNR
jgi:hypothetical protein